jgi:hypothetical protein
LRAAITGLLVFAIPDRPNHLWEVTLKKSQQDALEVYPGIDHPPDPDGAQLIELVGRKKYLFSFHQGNGWVDASHPRG